MTVLVTGAGLVGSHVAALLAAAGRQVILYDRVPRNCSAGVHTIEGDILEHERLVAILKAERVRAVIHTAACLGKAVRQSPLEGQRINVLGTATVAQACLQARVARMLYVSSLTVFPNDDGRPRTEEELPAPASLYGATKLAAENLLHGYRASYGLAFVTVRLATAYGPGAAGPGGGLGQHLRQALDHARVRSPVSLIDPGDCIYVKDAAQGIVRALARGIPGGTYHLGAGRLVTRKELADAVLTLFPGCDILPVPTTQVKQSWLDTTRAEREIGYVPQYSIGAALADWLNEIEQIPEEVST